MHPFYVYTSMRYYKSIYLCSGSLAYREMQIKTIMRFHLTLAKTAILQKSETTNARKDVKKTVS